MTLIEWSQETLAATALQGNVDGGAHLNHVKFQSSLEYAGLIIMPSDNVVAALNKPLADLTARDIQLIAEGDVAEDVLTEFKMTVPGGSWGPNSTSLRSEARKEILSEIIAFANAHGGTLYIGIAETEEYPKRSARINSVPAVAILGDRIAEIMRSCIDPRILAPEIRYIITNEADHSGILVVRVAPSALAPHWNKVDRLCHRRVGASSNPIEMLEIQRLTLEKATAAQASDKAFERRRTLFEEAYLQYKDLRAAHYRARGRSAPAAMKGYAIRATAVPVVPLRLAQSITARPDLRIGSLPYPMKFKDGRKNGSASGRSSASYHHFRPALRAWVAEQVVDYRHELTIQADGLLENSVMDLPEEDPSDPRTAVHLQTAFIFGEFLGLLMRVERFKHRTGFEGAAYELELDVLIEGDVPVYLSTAREQPGVFRFPSRRIVFPRILYEGRSQIEAVVETIQYDVFNAMGRMIDEHVPLFQLDIEDSLWAYLEGS